MSQNSHQGRAVLKGRRHTKAITNRVASRLIVFL
jgi:hypothetical protein